MTVGGDFISWVSGGDGVCRMKLQYETRSIAAGPGNPVEQECGGHATEPVTYFNEPHLICIACLPKFLTMPETARLEVPR
jgi:hypothetical protein